MLTRIRTFPRLRPALALSLSTSRPTAAPADPPFTYTKQTDETPEPRMSHAGTRTYVVAPKETMSYDVPGGAYGTSDPYVTPAATAAPAPQAHASTAPGGAHPNTTARVPQHPDGVGDSAAVRFRSSPGSMAPGADGGLGLMNAAGTQPPPAGPLADRNPPPGPEGGLAGNSEAWKGRK